METFAFLKTMSNQLMSICSVIRKAVFVCVLAGAAIGGPGDQAQAQTQAQASPDRLSVPLSDASRPALVKASLVNVSITVKAYEGKEVVVEARARNRERDREEGGLHRLAISATGLSVDEENNEV